MTKEKISIHLERTLREFAVTCSRSTGGFPHQSFFDDVVKGYMDTIESYANSFAIEILEKLKEKGNGDIRRDEVGFRDNVVTWFDIDQAIHQLKEGE